MSCSQAPGDRRKTAPGALVTAEIPCKIEVFPSEEALVYLVCMSFEMRTTAGDAIFLFYEIPGASSKARNYVLRIYICCIEMVEGGLAASADLEQLDGKTVPGMYQFVPAVAKDGSTELPSREGFRMEEWLGKEGIVAQIDLTCRKRDGQENLRFTVGITGTTAKDRRFLCVTGRAGSDLYGTLRFSLCCVLKSLLF